MIITCIQRYVHVCMDSTKYKSVPILPLRVINKTVWGALLLLLAGLAYTLLAVLSFFLHIMCAKQTIYVIIQVLALIILDC